MPSYTVNWPVTIDFSVAGSLSLPIADTCKIPGEFTLNCSWAAMTASERNPSLGLFLKWANLRTERQILRVLVVRIKKNSGNSIVSDRTTPFSLSTGVQATLRIQACPTAPKSNGESAYEFIVNMEVEDPIAARIGLPFAAYAAHYRLGVYDVKLYFPLQGHTLWTSSAILKAASPYFNDMLSSDFAESSIISESIPSHDKSEEVTVVSGNGHEAERLGDWTDSDDSDDENMDGPNVEFENAEGKGHAVGGQEAEPTFLPREGGIERQMDMGAADFDMIEVEAAGSGRASSGQLHAKREAITPGPHHHINITEARSKTYLAVLHWLLTGTIKFAPLRSHQIEQQHHDLPQVSAKSVFRLAHFLQIESLEKIALASFESQLTSDNVAAEMYSSLSGSYALIRDITISYACQHWKLVKNTPGMREVLLGMRDGKLEYQKAIGAELLLKLAEME